MKDKHNINTMSTRCFEIKVMLFIALFFVYGFSMTQAQTDDVTGYETVTVSIPATGYDPDAGGTDKGKPQMARVKFNRQFPLVITSDDGRKPEYVSNWALMNGYPNVRDWQNYPYLSGDDMLRVAYDKTYMGTRSSDVNDYQPMTFDDGTGHRRRFTLTSAVPPTGSSKTPSTASYDQINREDAKAMLRTGFSFAQHDVDDASSVETIKSDYARLNTLWAENVGIGLKVMVEPNGNKNYVEAAKQSDEICWNIYQAATQAYPALDNTMAQWTGGTQPSTYTTTKATTRTFPNSDAAGETAFANSVRTAISNGNTDPMFYGCHGLGSYAQNLLKDLATNATYKDKVWVTGADEFWEYYHIYNKVKIENVSYNGSTLTFDVKVPTYKKNQFRELTLNVPGLTGAGKPTFSSESGKTVPTTGSYRDNGSDGFTMNIGLESRFTDYVNQLRALYRDDQMNKFVKRDLKYLVDQLWDNTDYMASLNGVPGHDYTVKASLAGSAGPTLATIKTDTDGEKQYAVPRYIVSGGKLYETAKQAAQPFYKPTIQTSSTASGDVSVSYAEKDLTSYVGTAGNITPVAVCVVEGEDMAGATVVGASFRNPKAIMLGSNGLGGSVVDGKPITAINSLSRGKYKMIIGYGENYKAQGNYNYQILVGGTQVASFATNDAANDAITEFTTDEFTVEIANTPVTITTDNTNPNSRWIDYVVFVQTSSLDPVAPSITATASAGTAASVKVGTSITITATAAQNGGSNFTGTTIYQCSDAAGTIDGEAKATSATESATYTFTPDAAGTYYFKAVASDGTLGSNTTEVITVNVVANIDEYTLVIIDKSGGEAMTTTVQSSALTTDPLPGKLRSPYAENYKYYTTKTEAQANSGSYITALADFSQATIYVGYDVKSDGLKFDGSKAYTIYANSRYLHGVFQEGQAHVANNMWMLQRQSYDSWNSSNNNVTTTTFPFLDGSYLWYLQGSDPYNIRLQNKAARRYTSHENNSNAGYRAGFTTDAASSARYCLVYWNGSTSAADYCALWNRDYSMYVYMNSGTDNGSWRLDPSASKGEGKIYIADLPQLNINVLNPETHEVEYTVDGRFMSGATLPSAIPFYLQRAFTSGQKFYYTKADAIAGTNAISGTPDASSMTNDGSLNVYLTYTLDTNSWGTSGTIKPSVDENDAYWMSMTFPDGSRKLEAANSGTYEVNPSQTTVTKETPKLQWGFVGTPYSFRLINRANSGRVMGVDKSTTAATNAVMYANPGNEIACDWEMVNYQNGGSSTNPLIRLRGSISGEAPLLFVLSQANQKTLSTTEANNNRISSFTLIDEVHPAIPPTVTLTTTAAQTIEKKTVVTLKATPVWNGTTTLTSLQFQYKVTGGADGEWENIGEAITSITSGTEYTKVFTPTTAGTYSFRAVATDAEGTTGASAGDDATPTSGDAGLVTLSVVDDLPSTAPYSYKMKATLKDGDTEVDTQWLHEVESETELTNQHYFFPRYILNGSTLYETVTNPSAIATPNPVTHCKYGIYRNVDGQNQRDNLTYNKVAGKDNVVFYGEAENIGLTGGNRIPNNNNQNQFDWGKYEGRFTYFASNGYGWRVTNGDYGTITTLEPGKYTITVGLVGSSSADNEGAHVVKVGGNSVGTFTFPGTGNGGLWEFTTDEFSVYGNQAVVITHNDSKNNGLDYVYIQRTGDANVTAPTVTLSVTDANSKAIEANGESLVNTAVTLKATATMNGGASLKNLTFQQKTGSGEWTTISTVATPTSGTEYTTTFTPSATGTVYFRALATTVIDSSTEMTGSSQSDTEDDATAFAVSVVEHLTINEYTLHIIDNEGHDVFGDAITITKAEKDGLASGQDPLVTLRPQYASPFVSQYLYFNTAADAQANSGTATATTWDQADIYVGYTVDATKMGADKTHAIWANNNQYMHIIQNVKNSTNSQSSSHNAFVIQDQQYDVKDAENTKQNSNVNCTTLPILDNSYMWQLGTDPYNFKLKNRELGMYCSSNSINSNPTVYDSSEGASATSYCVLYWQSKAGVTDATQPYYRIVLKSAGAATENILMAKSNSWQTNNNTDGNWDSKGGIYIKELPAVNINILNAENEVECTLQGYYKSDATMPGNSTDGYTPHNIERVYTSQHKWYYSYTSAEVNDPVAYGSVLSTTKLEKSPNLYVKYTLDTSKWGTVDKNDDTNYLKPFTDSSEEYDWYYILSTNNSDKPFQAASGTLPATVTHCTVSDITTNTATDDSKRGQWAFTGTPYNVKIINRYYGANAYVGIHKDDVTINPLKIYAAGTADVFTSFEALSRFGGTDNIFLRPTAVFNGNAPYLYLGHYNTGIGETHTAVIDNAGANSKLTFHWVDNSPLEHPSTVRLTASITKPNVDTPVTLTAKATPDNKEVNNVTYLVIEQETSKGVWEHVGTAYNGTNVTGASKDDATGVVTVTYLFTPIGAGIYNFRAHAVIDDADQYSSDNASLGGQGSVLAITAGVEDITAGSDNYTLILVDKQGNELFTESNVSKTRVEETNSVSGRNGDPIDNSWRSPLVTLYKYYNGTEEGKASAQAADNSNLVDWATYTGTTVYVGYEVGNEVDLIEVDPTARQPRSATDNTMVRNAAAYTTMYMIKFKNGQQFYQESSDKLGDQDQAIYPYTCGDGALYIYGENKRQSDSQSASTTRERWPWFIVSQTGDPYHVVVTSWKETHTNEDTNYYNYLRTYYNSTTQTVVTNTISDDPRVKDTSLTGGSADNVPTVYMMLGTSHNYKLVTVDPISDGNTNERRTVSAMEQYWKTYETISKKGTLSTTELQNTDFTSKDISLNRYQNWAYGRPINAINPEIREDKTYAYDYHWYQTITMGETFDLEPIDLNGVLVLLDNHGWEIMRKPIATPGSEHEAEMKAAIRKYDSPMVKAYHFWESGTKVSGYHKYTVKTLHSDGTSLADYPIVHNKYKNIGDIYVTYDVKDEYAMSYTGAATAAGTSASKFVISQGGTYAKAAGSNITGVADAASADKWYLKPNFDIDKEMGYKYDLDADGKTGGTSIDEATTNANYYNNGQQGFDPYNLQIQNVSDQAKFFTTNAVRGDLDGIGGMAGTYNGDMAVTLTAGTRPTTTNGEGQDNVDLFITNATFMAVQDANGNMRLMPRFDHAHVVDGFSTLAAQAAAQPAADAIHAQTTQLTTGTITYHIIDNSGQDVFGSLIHTGAGFAVAKEYQSPMVEEYYFHSTPAHATNSETRMTSDKTSFDGDDEVWVSYKAKDEFASATWNIWNTDGQYMHAVSRNNQENKSNLWWMSKQHQDRDSNPKTTSLSTSNMPFLDNSFAWQFGTDPYNTTLFNKAAQRYVKQNDTSANNGRMDHLVTDAASATPYAILYYDNTQTNDNAILYDRTHSRYVGAFGNDKEWCINSTNRETTGKLVITQLPAIAINIVRNGKVECTLDGFYKSGCTWTPFVPLYLERYAASDQAFYYDQACENAISGQVNDATVTTNKAVYVSYTLDAAKWGTLDKNANTTIVMPSPTNDNKVEWYSMTSNSKTFAIDANNQLVSGTTGSGDTESEKKGQWALMGTPYSVKIVNRFAGSTNYLGIPAEIYNDPNQLSATIHPEGTANVFDTWEVCENMGTSNTDRLLQFRPQGSFNGQSTYGYLGQDGNQNGLLGLSGVPNGNLQVKLTFQKETDAKHVTFKLYDRNGHYMAETANGGIADVKIHGVSAGDQLADIFAQTHMERRYCKYTFYSDAGMTNAVTKASDNLEETVYVKWDYTDDAPVFNEGVTDPRDYQYYMLGVGNYSRGYTLMDVEGSGTPEDPYRFSPNNSVGTPRDQKHQFAIVGNPYGFKLYNREADKDIKRKENLEITFDDKESDGETATEDITFDLPIVSGATYSSTESHFRSTTTKRFLTINGSGDNAAFAMSDNAGMMTRFRYIIVPVRVFKEGAVSSTAEKDYRMYALEMNPSGTARTTGARITTNDLRATGNAIGNARDFNHAFCNYMYYQKYDWNTSVSAPVPNGGLSYYGGKDQNKRQFIATYTVDQEAFERLYYLDNSPNHNEAYSSKGAESMSNAGSYTTAFNTQLEDVKNDATDVYRWRFTGDPYDLQIHNVNTDKQSEDYVLAVKKLTDAPNTTPTEAAGTLALVTKDVKDGDSDTESYGQYSHWEIIKRSDNYYVLWNIDETGERYTYALTTRTDKLNKGILYVTVPPFENGSTTKLNINQVEWNLVDVFNHYDVTWHVMEKSGENNYTEVATEKKVVDENVTLTIEDLPASVKRHFCDYEKMYSDAACTTEITEKTVNAATDIYVPYTLDSGAPEFVTEAPTGTPTGTESYWYEIHFPDAGSYLYTDGTSISKDYSNINSIRTGEGATTYPHYRWALIGSPYDVKFYNMKTKNFMTNDGTALSMGSTGTSFDLLDNTVGYEHIEGLGTIFDTATSTYITGNAGLLAYQSGYTACEFSNVNGVVHIVFRLHYSDKTLRKYDSDEDGDLSDEPEGNAVNTLGNIDITTFQKRGKDLNEIFPLSWKRAFCNYTYYWKDGTGENSTISEIGTTQTEVTQKMIDAFNNDPNHQPIYVHVTYDFEGGQNPKWSTADKKYTGKHWYYLVNNHRPSGEQGKMVYRDVSPKLRVSTSLQQNRLYLNNFEWCVIGDPYGFKMLNRYDPDRRFDEYIRVTGDQDSHGDGLQLEQSSTDSQNIFEMMPGQYSYNFWIHPIYNQNVMDEYTSEMSYVGNNFNGSAAIIPNDQRSMTYLKTNSSANFRLEIQSDATLAEYVKYAGFVGGLEYDLAEPYQDDATDNSFTNEEKAAIRTLVDNPDNIVQMTQGYYRIVPFTTEKQEAGQMVHKYLRGYWSETEQTGGNLKVISQSSAEYAPTSIFWFEGTKEDGTNYPRYNVKTQGLGLSSETPGALDDGTPYKVRYEDVGAAITQLRIADPSNNHNYLSCTSTEKQTSTNQCFDEQAGQFKTRFYLQKVGTGGNEMPYKINMVKGHNGINGEYLLGGEDNPYGKLPYTYWSIYVPYDMEIVGGLDAERHTLTAEQCDVVPFIGIRENYHPVYSETGDTYYNKGEYALICQSIDMHQKMKKWKGSNLFIPAATPVFFRSRSGMTGVTFKVPTTKPTTDTDELRITENCLRGTYLSRENPSDKIRVFGKEAKLVDGTWYYTGRVGLFPRSSTSTPLTDNGIYYVEEDHISSRPNASSARAVFLTFDEGKEVTTGIYSAVGTPEKDVIYDLQGRKMTGTLKAGVYIKNGRKIVVK